MDFLEGHDKPKVKYVEVLIGQVGFKARQVKILANQDWLPHRWMMKF